MEHIEDILTKNLKMVFVVWPQGNMSAELKCYYAHPANLFWKLLHETGATHRRFEPSEFRELLKLNIGLTDLFKDQSGMDKDIYKKDFDIKTFEKKILKFSPRKLAFTSKNVGEVYFQKPGSKLQFGLQEKTIGKTKLFILPGTSPANKSNWKKWPEYMDYWQEFVEF